MYIFSLVAGSCGATSVDASAFKIYGDSKKKDKSKSVKATTTTTTTMTAAAAAGARGTTLVYVYTRVFRLYGLYA